MSLIWTILLYFIYILVIGYLAGSHYSQKQKIALLKAEQAQLEKAKFTIRSDGAMTVSGTMFGDHIFEGDVKIKEFEAFKMKGNLSVTGDFDAEKGILICGASTVNMMDNLISASTLTGKWVGHELRNREQINVLMKELDEKGCDKFCECGEVCANMHLKYSLEPSMLVDALETGEITKIHDVTELSMVAYKGIHLCYRCFGDKFGEEEEARLLEEEGEPDGDDWDRFLGGT